ncbi:MAG: T9SS type A sorting domain-containing protein [Bacteroidales bacterium]|nr:T9SS type A sorting domain-containing protein [Bacteroidales bacterium]
MLNLKLKNLTFISVFCLLSILTFGQNTKNIANDIYSANRKNSELRINNNLNTSLTDNTTKPALNQLTQIGAANSITETYEKDAVFADRNPKDEVLDRRDRTSKHFRNPDGSFDAILSTGSVNYFEKGAWLTIERAILPNNTREYPDYEFANTKNSFKTYFSTDQSKGIKTVIEGQEISEWQNKKIEFLDENLNLISAIKAENGKLNTNEAKAIYSNIFPYTEAHITQLFDGRKIDYEISSPEFLNHIPANSKYLAVSEDIILPKGWIAKYYIDKLNENPTESKKQISVFNEKGDEILRYMPPAYFEKNNEHTIENPIGDYIIQQVGQILTVQILVETDWLRNENREFPVVIDPTVSVYPDNATNWTRSADGGGSTYTNLRFGIGSSYWYVTGMKFNTTSITSGSTVSAVRGYFYITEAYEAWGGGVQFAYSADPTTNSGTNLYNGVTGALSNSLAMAAPNPGWKSIALNSTGVTHVQNNIASSVNLGLDPTTGYSYYGQYYAAVNHTNANRPYLSITYTVPSGPPSCATPVSPTNGASATGHSGSLEWSAPGATKYDVYFGTASTPPLVSTNQEGTTYDIGTCLTPETTYYWKVIAKNGDGDATGCSTWSFTTDNKLNIYKNDWETANVGYFGTSGTSVDGWYANNASGSGGYYNIWTVGQGPLVISGKSVGVSALQNLSFAGNPFQYWSDLGELYRWIYRPIDLTGLRDVELTFRWKCGGESGQDFGTVATSINGGTNWLTDNQGGLYSDGKYWNSASTIRTQTLTFPDTRNNQSDFQLAFKWNDLSGNGTSNDPSFVVDDIVMKACPYEGTLSSPDQTVPFAWAPPTANTTTTITVNGTHDCAYFEWEQSTDNGANWIVLSGENNASYTTPSNIITNTFYRCRVYFSTGCPGVYQSEPFKIVFAPDCTTLISPLYGSNIQSTSFRLSWNTDPLATSYDVYFGEDNPPATMIGNTANMYYDIDNLNFNTTYYWQIIPTNAAGSASGCDTWSFTTGAEPPQFHNYGGAEQLTFNNSAYKVDIPTFRISHPTNTMDEVQIQISQDVTFPGETVFDGNFTGSFSGENNFETSLEGAIINESYFPQAFNTNVLTTGGTAANNTWFAPNSHTPFAWTASGGNPDGRVGYSGSYNNYWSNFLRLPEVDASGMDEITLSFDVWHSYFASHPNDKLYLSAWADGGYINLPQTVKIDGAVVTASANIGSSGYAFYFTEERNAANIQVTLDISGITDKSSILLYLNPSCGYDNSNEFYVYFDNVDVTGTAQEFTNGGTYYARARGKIGGNWTDWTSETHSFTYKNQTEIEWHQTAEPQFETGVLSDVITATSPDLVTLAEPSGTPANPFANPSFETNNSDWTSYATGGSEVVVNKYDSDWKSQGSRAGRMYMFGGYAMSSDVGIISQVVDLTDIEQIIFDARSAYSPNFSSSLSNGGTLRLIIGGTSSNTTGTVYATVNHCVSGSSSCTNVTLDRTVNIDPADRIPNQTVKFVWTGFTSGDLGGALVSFSVDNIRPGVSSIETGTITTTPINLPSFYQEDSWYEFSWNQTLNSGGIKFSIEKDNAGTWEAVTGLTNISSTTDGDNNLSIESIGSCQQIRLKATFTESGAKGTQPELNNWAVKTKKDEPLPVELLYFTAECNGNSKEFTWATASETNSDYFQIMASTDGKNFIPVAKVQAAGHSSQNIKYNYTLIGQNAKTYYRLKQVDFDGSSETFNIIHVDCGNDVNSQITAYPNPFDGKILYLNSSSTLENAVINIYDALGRLVYQTKCDEISSHTELKIDSQLEPGAYYLKISSENEVEKRISLIVK